MTGVLGPLITGLVVVITGLITYRQATRALKASTRLENRKVDAEAYERARKFDQEVAAGIRAELDRARAELADLRAELRREQKENRELRRQIDQLERTMQRLRDRLTAAGFTVDDAGGPPT